MMMSAALMMMSDVLAGQSSTEKFCQWPSSLPQWIHALPFSALLCACVEDGLQQTKFSGFHPLCRISQWERLVCTKGKGVEKQGKVFSVLSSLPWTNRLICLSQVPPVLSCFCRPSPLHLPFYFSWSLDALSTMFSSLNFPHRVTWLCLRSLY